jgi:hypothetical protein
MTLQTPFAEVTLEKKKENMTTKTSRKDEDVM